MLQIVKTGAICAVAALFGAPTSHWVSSHGADTGILPGVVGVAAAEAEFADKDVVLKEGGTSKKLPMSAKLALMLYPSVIIFTMAVAGIYLGFRHDELHGEDTKANFDAYSIGIDYYKDQWNNNQQFMHQIGLMVVPFIVQLMDHFTRAHPLPLSQFVFPQLLLLVFAGLTLAQNRLDWMTEVPCSDARMYDEAQKQCSITYTDADAKTGCSAKCNFVYSLMNWERVFNSNNNLDGLDKYWPVIIAGGSLVATPLLLLPYAFTSAGGCKNCCSLKVSDEAKARSCNLCRCWPRLDAGPGGLAAFRKCRSGCCSGCPYFLWRGLLLLITAGIAGYDWYWRVLDDSANGGKDLQVDPFQYWFLHLKNFSLTFQLIYMFCAFLASIEADGYKRGVLAEFQEPPEEIDGGGPAEIVVENPAVSHAARGRVISQNQV